MDDDARHQELDRIRLVTQADVQRFWELFLGPLGFGSPSLWVAFIAADGRPLQRGVQIEDEDGRHSWAEIDQFYEFFEERRRELGPDVRLAMLISRPGRGPVDRDDARFARLLVDGARRNGVPVEPVHVATDVAVWPVTPDDLAA